jgi:hypothetical protein
MPGDPGIDDEALETVAWGSRKRVVRGSDVSSTVTYPRQRLSK